MTEFLLLAALAGSIIFLARAMLPMAAVRLQLGTLLAADPTTLAPASTPNQVALIISPFSLAESLVVSDLTLGATLGLAPLAGIAGTQGVAQDPISGAQILTLLPPVTGWRWVTSGTWTTPITVYGAALTNAAGTTLLGAMQLATPIILTEPGFQVDIDPLQMTFVLQPLS